jgi:poly(3-hydroxybutyrate) depolymerase
VRARVCVVVLVAVVVAACGGHGHASRARSTAGAVPTTCADRLPLDTLLDVPGGPRRPRPLILALHGAGQGGYGLQRYTGLSDDARDFVVAYPNTPHRNGFWSVDDVPRLLALVDAIGRCVPVSVLSIHGTHDQVVPYRGLRAFVASWARRDGCAPLPSATTVDVVTHLRWHGCADGARVEHLRVAGDTHGWPSLEDANERMVRFLRAAL